MALTVRHSSFMNSLPRELVRSCPDINESIRWEITPATAKSFSNILDNDDVVDGCGAVCPTSLAANANLELSIIRENDDSDQGFQASVPNDRLKELLRKRGKERNEVKRNSLPALKLQDASHFPSDVTELERFLIQDETDSDHPGASTLSEVISALNDIKTKNKQSVITMGSGRSTKCEKVTSSAIAIPESISCLRDEKVCPQPNPDATPSRHGTLGRSLSVSAISEVGALYQTHPVAASHVRTKSSKSGSALSAFSLWQSISSTVSHRTVTAGESDRFRHSHTKSSAVSTQELTGKPTRVNSFFGGWSQKSHKHKKLKPHFFINLDDAKSNACCVCRLTAKTGTLQCNNCQIIVHSHCKANTSFCPYQKHSKTKRALSNMDDASSRVLPNSSSQSVISKATSSSKHHVAAVEIRNISAVNGGASALSNEVVFSADSNDLTETELNEPEAWCLTVSKSFLKDMHSRDVKRQEIIYELTLTEKKHCRVLAILLNVFYPRLSTVVSKSVLDSLMPAIASLHKLHFCFFRRLRDRQRETALVGQIHDILLAHFSGQPGDEMMQSYIQFCSQKQTAVTTYHELFRQNVEFQTALKDISSKLEASYYPGGKNKSMPDCLLLVAQRLTKYHVLIEQLRKNTREETGELPQISKAEEAVKHLIFQINAGVECYELNCRRHEIFRSFDAKSIARFGGFTFEAKDLICESRQLLCDVSAVLKCPQKHESPNVAVGILVFNDVVAFVQCEKNVYSFVHHDKPAVVPIKGMIVREVASGLRFGSSAPGLYLICINPLPEMFEIRFLSKKDFGLLHRMLNECILNCSQLPSNFSAAATTPATASVVDRPEVERLCAFFRNTAICNEAFDAYFGDKIKQYTEFRSFVEKICSSGDVPLCKRILQILDEGFGMAEPSALNLPICNPNLWPNQLIYADVRACVEYYLNKQMSQFPSSAKRSQTFHGLEMASVKQKKKSLTVTGISLDLPEGSGFDVSSFTSKEANTRPQCPEITTKLLQHLGKLSLELERARNENIVLTGELLLLKEAKSGSGPTKHGLDFYATQLETLRRKDAEISRQKQEFDRQCDDKRTDLAIREKRLEQQEAQFKKAEEELLHKWKRLSDCWETRRRQGLDLPSLSSDYFPPVVKGGEHLGPSEADFTGGHSSFSGPKLGRIQSARSLDVPEHLKGAAINELRLQQSLAASAYRSLGTSSCTDSSTLAGSNFNNNNSSLSSDANLSFASAIDSSYSSLSSANEANLDSDSAKLINESHLFGDKTDAPAVSEQLDDKHSKLKKGLSPRAKIGDSSSNKPTAVNAVPALAVQQVIPLKLAGPAKSKKKL